MALEDILIIKFGGEVVDSANDLSNLLDSVQQLYKQGEKIVLVHGGGPRASQLSQQLGIVPNKVGGRRITDAPTLEVMKMTLPGLISSDILCMMKAKKIPSCSLSGISLFQAQKRPPVVVSGSNQEKIDFGFVGDVHGVDIELLQMYINNNIIPVISPLCSSDKGVGLNINADTVATSLALHTKAKGIVLITKVGAVFKNIDDQSTKISTLTIEQAKKCIADGIIQGGMIPKIEECFKLLHNGLSRVHIVGTQTNKTLLNEIVTPGSEGTVLTS